MRLSVYDRSWPVHASDEEFGFPLEVAGSEPLSYDLVVSDLVSHVMDAASLGLVVASCGDVVTVLWSVAPGRPYA